MSFWVTKVTGRLIRCLCTSGVRDNLVLCKVQINNMVQGEIGAALADPNVAMAIAFGPPFPVLTPQDNNSGLRLGGRYEHGPKRMVFKKAHLSREDFRIFDQASGRLICVSHHHGKNPYESLDPLGVGYNPNQHQLLGEMESLCNITGAELQLYSIYCAAVHHRFCSSGNFGCLTPKIIKFYFTKQHLSGSKGLKTHSI